MTLSFAEGCYLSSLLFSGLWEDVLLFIWSVESNLCSWLDERTLENFNHCQSQNKIYPTAFVSYTQGCGHPGKA